MLKGSDTVKILTPQVKVHIFYPSIGAPIYPHPYMGIKAKKSAPPPYTGYQFLKFIKDKPFFESKVYFSKNGINQRFF